MRINRDCLSARAGSIAKEKGVSANVMRSMYSFGCNLKCFAFLRSVERFTIKLRFFSC